MRFLSTVALATLLLAAAPARAGWQRTRFVDAGGAPATPPALNLKAVGVGAGGKVWAVGGSGTASFVLVSTDGFATARQDTSCASINRILNTVWVAPDGGNVHAFGNANAHAAWNGTSWGCANLSPPAALGVSVNVNASVFADADSGTFGGGSTMSPLVSMLVQYASGTLTNASYINNSSVVTMARSSASGALLFSTGTKAYRYPDPAGSPFATLGGTVNSMFLLGDAGLLSAGDPAYLRKIDASVPSATAPGGTLPDFNILGVTLAPAGFALAVGQVTASTTVGAIAQSLDGGDSWKRIDLSGITPAVKTLRAAACWDENGCVAVGANDLGGGVYEPEMLVYANQAPTAVVTVNGQASPWAPVLDDADVTMAVAVSDPEGDPVTVTWTGPTGVDGSHAPSVTFTPAVSCSTQTLLHALDATDGRMALAPPLDVPVVVNHAPRPPSVPTLTPAPPSANTYVWAAGSTNKVTAKSTKDCSRPVSFTFKPDGVLPSPAVSGAAGEVATYDLPDDCGGRDGQIVVTVTDSDSSVAPVDSQPYLVHVPEIVEAPAASLSRTTVDVGFGEQGDVVATVDGHCSGTEVGKFDFQWSCAGATAFTVKAANAVEFANVEDPCGSADTCAVTVTPKTGPCTDPATCGTRLGFTVNLKPSTEKPSVTITPPGGVLPAGGTIQVKATTNVCNATLTWSCPGLADPGHAQQWSLANPDPNCAGGTYACTVTAENATTRVSATADFVLGQSSPPTFVTTRYWPDTQSLEAEGSSVTATVQAANACATEFDWAWQCSGAPAPADPTATSLTLVHPGGLCEEQQVRCNVTAKPRNGPGLEGKGSVEVTYEAAPQAATGLKLVAGAEGNDLVARAEALVACAGQPRFRWKVWKKAEPEPAQPEPETDSATLRRTFSTCDTVEVKVYLVGTALEERAEVAFVGGVPVVSLSAPEPYALDCREQRTFELGTSRVDHDCGATRAWRQVDGPAVPARVEGGVLSLEPALADLPALWGSGATFEVVVTNALGPSAPANVRVTFEQPGPFVDLQHDSDRRSASAGEPVHFTVTASTDCVNGYDGVMDLWLRLEGLDLVPGSSKVDGANVDDPAPKAAPNDGQVWLVFSGLSTPAAGTVPRTVTYYARRQASASGVVVSKAVARLHADDRVAISEESHAGGRPPVKSTALSCHCSASEGGGRAWPALALLIAGAAARGRRKNPPC